MQHTLTLLTIAGLMAAAIPFGWADTDTSNVRVTLNEIALLGLDDPSPLKMSITAPSVAGDLPQGTVNSDKWLNYTSTVAPGRTRNITVAAEGSFPAGTRLRVSASTPTGSGALGTPVLQPVVASSTAQALVEGIGGCWTGTGSAGAQLTLSFEVADMSQLTPTTSGHDVALTFTLTDAN